MIFPLAAHFLPPLNDDWDGAPLLPKSPGIARRRSRPKHLDPTTVSQQPILVIEEMKEHFHNDTCAANPPNTSLGIPGSKMNARRAPYISRIHLVFASENQLYLASRLDVPHYHILAKELDYMKRYCCRYSIQLETYETTKDQKLDSFLRVFNSFDTPLQNLVDSIDFEEISNFIDRNHDTKADVRGNKYRDEGFCSGVNTEKLKKHFGAAAPRTRGRADDPLSEADKRIYEHATVTMSRMVDLVCDPLDRGKIYRDPKSRVGLFAATLTPNGENLIEQVRFAKVYGDNICNCHLDDMNCKKKNNSPVLTLSKLIYNFEDKRWERVSIICYSRKSITECLTRREQMRSVVVPVIDFFKEKKKEGLTEVNVSLFEGLGPQKRRKTIEPHCNKCVFYAGLSVPIEKVGVKYNLSQYQICQFLVLSVASENPAHFERALDRYEQTEMQTYQTEYPEDSVPPNVYNRFYKNYLLPEYRNDVNDPIVGGRRHQPTNFNTITLEQFDYAACLLFDLSHAFKERDRGKFRHKSATVTEDENFFVIKAIALISCPTNGITGVGEFLAQHILAVGALLGIFPMECLLCATISKNTGLFDWLKENTEFFAIPSKKEHDSKTILQGLAVCLDGTPADAENGLCKFVQRRNAILKMKKSKKLVVTTRKKRNQKKKKEKTNELRIRWQDNIFYNVPITCPRKVIDICSQKEIYVFVRLHPDGRIENDWKPPSWRLISKRWTTKSLLRPISMKRIDYVPKYVELFNTKTPDSSVREKIKPPPDVEEHDVDNDEPQQKRRKIDFRYEESQSVQAGPRVAFNPLHFIGRQIIELPLERAYSMRSCQKTIGNTTKDTEVFRCLKNKEVVVDNKIILSQRYKVNRQMWSAVLLWSDGHGKTKTWNPSNRFKKSLVLEEEDEGQLDTEGRRWFHKKRTAVRHTLLLAFLNMDKKKTEALFSKYLRLDISKQADRLDFVTLFDDQHHHGADRLPFAVAKRHGTNIAFYLVDEDGVAKKGSDIIWVV
jgi:hypothetical protein